MYAFLRNLRTEMNEKCGRKSVAEVVWFFSPLKNVIYGRGFGDFFIIAFDFPYCRSAEEWRGMLKA